MDINNILSHCDHTLLAVDATWEQIRGICDDGIKYSTASVCIPASYVKQAKEYVGDKLAICTVIGFPNGYSTSAAKAFEAADAVKNGADEIDMVINVGNVKDGKYDEVLEEIKAVKAACDGRILKVIIETCLLTDEEKIQMCRVVTESGADFIKTSTGFSKGGATREDIALFAANIGENVRMKAAGGIRSLEDAQDFLDLGCERLGTSAIVKIVKNQVVQGY
ncbi:MAG: deoxyribose-phosphate aldolase [Clostridia bacterium]|nr:deoxyribose-phosphate aldolase [Clostridia bacterium]